MNFTLAELDLVDASPQPDYDNLTKLASEILGVPVSLVSIVDFENDRQFFKSQIGLPEPWATEQQTPLSHSFCQHVVKTNAPLIVENALEHELVKDNLAIRDLGVVSYLGVPIYTPDSQPTGALCAIDGKPRQWTEKEIELLKQLSLCVTDTIKLKASLLTSEGLRQEQRDFTYAISHDLKSPANTLHMLLNEIGFERDKLSEKGQSFLDISLNVVNRMKDQVEDVLAYARTGINQEAHVRVDLNTILEDVLDGLKSDIVEKNAKINFTELPIVTGCPKQLHPLFQNLVSNALKFQADGNTPSIDILASSDPQNRYDIINITDNGIGIPQEFHKRIFKLFERLHTREDYPGTGVGLALCNRVISNHNGKISLQSEPNVGTTFTLKFPRKNDG